MAKVIIQNTDAKRELIVTRLLAKYCCVTETFNCA